MVSELSGIFKIVVLDGSGMCESFRHCVKGDSEFWLLGVIFKKC